ncbi:hypothetical protein EYF80_029119 [Liparis tanakae]|uniref:Uncharacterized protein n=1 Tax=Liparis tanakae TaxID=230148 RepID=A0A4Z2H4C2_9TELE|nr:hypothetical protein EYF80_029119 [Liparis tanakae]
MMMMMYLRSRASWATTSENLGSVQRMSLCTPKLMGGESKSCTDTVVSSLFVMLTCSVVSYVSGTARAVSGWASAMAPMELKRLRPMSIMGENMSWKPCIGSWKRERMLRLGPRKLGKKNTGGLKCT